MVTKTHCEGYGHEDYATSIGFYRKHPGTDIMDNHPIMIAKWPSGIKMRKNVNITFVIRIDF